MTTLSFLNGYREGPFRGYSRYDLPNPKRVVRKSSQAAPSTDSVTSNKLQTGTNRSQSQFTNSLSVNRLQPITTMVGMNNRPYLSLGITAASQANQSLHGISQVLLHNTPSPSTFLDSDFLQDHESSILASLRSSQHRSLQANNCMNDLFGTQSLTCTANDVEIIGITGITNVDHPDAYLDTDGLWKDACLGNDDHVTLSVIVDIRVRNARYDIGMYINTKGGSASSGTCAMSLISETNFMGGTADRGSIDFHGCQWGYD